MAGFKDQMRKQGKDSRPAVEIADLLREENADEFVNQAKEKGLYLELEPDRFIPDDTQPRKTFTPDGLEELRESIEARGQIQPLLVRPQKDGKYPIIAGERRWRAISSSQKVKLVKAIISSGVTDELNVLLIQLDENNKRESVPVMETVMAMKRVVDLCKSQGKNQAHAAEMLGVNKGRLSKYLSLLDAPIAVQGLSEGNETQDLDTLYTLGRAARTQPEKVDELIRRWRDGGLTSPLREAAIALTKEGEEGPVNKKKTGSEKRAVGHVVRAAVVESGSGGSELVLEMEGGTIKKLPLSDEIASKLRAVL